MKVTTLPHPERAPAAAPFFVLEISAGELALIGELLRKGAYGFDALEDATSLKGKLAVLQPVAGSPDA